MYILPLCDDPGGLEEEPPGPLFLDEEGVVLSDAERLKMSRSIMASALSSL